MSVSSKNIIKAVTEAESLGDSKIIKSAHKWFTMVDNPHSEYFLEVRTSGLASELVINMYIDYKYDNIDKYAPDDIDISWGFSSTHHDPAKMIEVLQEALEFKKTIEEYCKFKKN